MIILILYKIALIKKLLTFKYIIITAFFNLLLNLNILSVIAGLLIMLYVIN